MKFSLAVLYIFSFVALSAFALVQPSLVNPAQAEIQSEGGEHGARYEEAAPPELIETEQNQEAAHADTKRSQGDSSISEILEEEAQKAELENGSNVGYR